MPFTGICFHFANQTENPMPGFMLTHVSKLAIASVNCSVFGGSSDELNNSSQKIIAEEILKIGGGNAGIQAAQEIANTNHKVCLLERTGKIGGHLAISDKTFPTHESVACIHTPKKTEILDKSSNELHVNSYFLQIRN